jgi:4-hydroxy-2-oxoheptanedioate aldolase
MPAAEASFADGAQLVVYNLTATVMAHLAELRTASPPTVAWD